jgi:hypothetical protein
MKMYSVLKRDDEPPDVWAAFPLASREGERPIIDDTKRLSLL